MMIEKKIKKYLLNQPEISFFHKNESGSEYFKVGESLIRLSNHVAIKNNQPDTLNIVVTGENFVVMYGNRLINVNDYTGFKNFLKYHIQMCDCFKDFIHAGLNYVPRQNKPVQPKQPTKSYTGARPPRQGDYVFSLKDFSVAGLSEAQITSLTKLTFTSKEAARKTIDHYRAQNAQSK